MRNKYHQPGVQSDKELFARYQARLPIIRSIVARERVMNEYRVRVEYRIPYDKETLEAEFSKEGVSDLLHGGFSWYDWEMDALYHPSDYIPGELTFLIVCFGREMDSHEAINEMSRQNCRPANHAEAYAFAKAYPRLQQEFSIVVLGSLERVEEWVIVLNGDSTERTIDSALFSDRWPSSQRFLLVRKSPSSR